MKAKGGGREKQDGGLCGREGAVQLSLRCFDDSLSERCSERPVAGVVTGR